MKPYSTAAYCAILSTLARYESMNLGWRAANAEIRVALEASMSETSKKKKKNLKSSQNKCTSL